MNESTTPFHLSASATPFDPQVASVAELPAEVAGQPASYFWKEMIHAGDYAHPTRGYSLAVDQNRMALWARTGANMLAAGLAIPINCDHSDRARDVVGYIKEFKLEEERLLALCQFIGDDAARTAARNLVSIGIDPDFTDGQGRQWGEAIVHLALTPVPMVPDQGVFEKAAVPAEQPEFLLPAAAAGGGSIACKAEEWERLRGLLPDGAEVTPSDCIAHVIDHLSAQASSASLRAELSAAQQRIAELSSKLPPAISEESQAAMVESATAKFDLAVASGGLSPTARDRLVAALVQSPQGQPNLIALSRQANPRGDRSLALAIADALLDNEPIEIGESTGLQTLARLAPGGDSSPIDELRSYMTKVASVSG